MRHLPETGVREPPERGGAHVGGVPVPGQCRPPEDPHCHDDHHIQENIRQPRHAVEVSFGILWGSLRTKTLCTFVRNSFCLSVSLSQRYIKGTIMNSEVPQHVN